MTLCFYIFVDESGDLGQYGTKSFNISALITENPKPIENRIKHIRERRLRKSLEKVPRLKANNSSPEIRKFVLEGINKCNCRLATIVVDKSKNPGYLKENPNQLYNYIAGLLLQAMGIAPSNKVYLVYAKRETNKLLRNDFEKYLTTKFKELFPDRTIELHGLYEHQNRALQAVDFVAWAVNRKFSHDDNAYFKIIEGKTTIIPL
jgi:hypothetical protein